MLCKSYFIIRIQLIRIIACAVEHLKHQQYTTDAQQGSSVSGHPRYRGGDRLTVAQKGTVRNSCLITQLDLILKE